MSGFSRGRPFRPLGLIIAFSFVVHLAVSAPSREKRAAPSCANEVGTANSKLKYENGHTYTYDFESELVTQIVGGSDGDSRLKVKGQAALAVISSCEYILTVVKLDLVSPSQQASALSAIEKSSLKFTYQNGLIDSESISLSKDDPAWSANIKRAIVSTFQNHALDETEVTSLSFRESDVTGSDCLTKYTITGSTYVKTRDLNHCSKRDGGIWVGQGLPYKTTKPRILQSNPLLKSSQTCTQDFSSGKLQSVKCTEVHKLEVYNPGGVGAQTTVSTSLKLSGDQAGNTYAASFKGSEPVGIAYDHSDDSDKSLEGGAAGSTRKLLEQLCKEVAGGIFGPKVSSLYLDMRRQIGRTAVNDLRTIYGDLKCSRDVETEKVKVLFQDAAANAGTTSAIEFVAKLCDTLDVRAQGLFRLSLGFAHGPEESALESVATLLSSGDSKLLLSASGLAHQYCLSTNHDCGKSAAYNSISDNIAAQAKANCASKEEVNVKKAIVALQALGNLDSLSKSAVEAISSCLASPSDRVVDQAIQGFRRDSCEESLKAKAREILKNENLSSDLRIHAYLAIANCLTEDDAAFISDVIAGPASQVYWFIASHRHNQLHSDNQAKATSPRKHAFNLIKIRKASLKPDARKYSSNIDLSAFDKRENIGGSFEGNIMYSADSFVPKTISSDLSFDWLGRSYDLFEVGVSLNDFESLAERLFRRILREEEVDDAGADTAGKRRKRDVAEPNFQQSDVQALQAQTKVTTLHETNGVTDFYVRLFGTTVCVESYLLDDVLKETAEVEAAILERIKKGLVGLNFDLTQGFPYFIDNLIVPTISGFPVTLELESTAAVSLKVTGDLVEGSSLKSRIAPSGSIQTRGRLVAGAGPVEAGLQIEANLHSASDLSVELNMVPGKTKGYNVDAKINFPQDKTHLVDIRSDLYWVSRSGNDLPAKTAVQSKLPAIVLADNVCLDTVSEFFGLKYCADVKLAQIGGGEDPVFPLTGPVFASITVEKSDPSVKDYLFQLHVDNEENADMHLSLVFDTPGSSKSRRIVLTATGVKQPGGKEKSLDLIIESPWKKLTGTGKYVKAPKGSGFTRTRTFDVKADGTTTVLQLKTVADYDDKSFIPLSTSLDLDLKYGMQSQHSLTVNTKFDHQTTADLSFEAKVASSRLPYLNFDIKWDRTVSWELLKFNLALNQGLSDKNTISLNSVTTLGPKIDSNTDLKVTIPVKKLDISYKSELHVDKASLSVDGGCNLKAGPIEASSKISLNGLTKSFDIQLSGSGAGKKLTFSSAGDKAKGEYTLKLNVDPKIFDLDVKTNVVKSKTDAGTKLEVKTTATTSLLPTPISTTVELSLSDVEKYTCKIAAQLNLGNDRVASGSFETFGSDLNKMAITVKGFVQKKLDATYEIKVDVKEKTVWSKTDITYIPLGRHIQLEGKIGVTDKSDKGEPGGTYHVEGDVKWDADKDPKQSLSFSTDGSFSLASKASWTKNTLTLKGHPYKLNIEINPGNEFLNEEHSWKLSYQSGADREHTIGFQAKVESSEKAKKVTVGAQLDLDSVPGVPKEIKLELGASELDLKSFYFDSLSRLEVTPRDGSAKLLEIEISTKPAPKGRSVRAEVRDDLIFHYGFDTSADIGSDGVDIKYERSADGKKLALVKLGVSKSVSGNYKEIKVSTVYDRDFASAGPTFEISGNYKYRFASLWDFEVIEIYTLADRTNGADAARNADSSITLKISPSDFVLISVQSVKAPDWDEKADFNINGKLDGKKFSGSVDIKFTNNSETIQVVKSDLSVSPGFPGDSELSFTLTLPPVVKYQNIALTIKHDEVTKGLSYNNLINAKINDIQIELSTKLERGAKKSADFNLKLNKDPVRILKLSLEGTTMQASIQWGDEPLTISTSGKVIPVGEGFDVELDFDSPLLPDKRWELKISRRVEATKKSISMNLDNPSSKQNFKFGLTKETQDATNKYSLNYDAKLTLKPLRGLLQDKKGDASLEINRKAFDAAREKAGTEIKLDVALNTLTLKLNAKKSDLEGKLSASVCPNNECTTADALILQDGGSLKASADVIRKGIKVGFSAENKKSGDGCDTTATVYYPRRAEQQELGLRIFSGDGSDSDLELSKKEISAASSSVRKYGAELTSGPRTVSLVAAKGNWDSDAADADAFEIRFWLDKSREPARSLSLSLSNVMASEGKQGRDVSLRLSHPDFKKDHRLKTSYRFDSAGSSLFDITTEIDIFKTTADALVVKVFLKQDLVGDSPVFKIGKSLKSEGQGLSWEFVCSNIKIEEGDRTFTCKFDGKSATRGDKSITWDYARKDDSINYEVKDNEGLIFKFTGAPRVASSGSGKEYVTTFQLPGMTDSWVREIRNNEDPTGIAYRGYGSSYPADKYTEAYLGVFSASKLTLGGGARSSEGGTKTDLYKYSLEVNRPGPDVFLANWNKDAIKKFLDDTNTRSDAVSKGMAEFIRKRGNNNAERIQQIVSGFKDALPDLAPFLQKVYAVNNELKQEGGGVTQGLVAFAARSKRAATGGNKIQAALSAVTESIAKSVEALANSRRASINKLKALFDQISQWPPTEQTLQAMKQPVKDAVKGALEKANGLNLKAQSYEKGFAEKVLKKVRTIILDLFEDAYDDNLKGWKEAFPYPNVEQFLDSLPEYIEGVALRPNETTPEARADISEKLDRALLQIAEKAFNADFQKGTIESHIPIAKLLGLGALLEEDSDDDEQAYPSIGILNIILGLISPRRVLPPVDAVGVVIEGSHFQSFDGIVKPFGTACQYLLTSDFVDNKFTVAIDIQKKDKNATQSLIVTDGKDTVVISGGPTIYVNGKTSEPTVVGAFTVKQTKRWTVVKGKMGVRVSCLRSEDRQLCEIQASGYYHGKLRGVLGNFNNDITDEKTLPSGTKAEGTENFVKSWQLNKDCRGGKLNPYLLEYKYYTSILNNENLNTVFDPVPASGN